ncbi:hypothetical protein [Methyloprofundus sedimenti]|nr:hypothetical protein [Methyloprofundus sedimenti]
MDKTYKAGNSAKNISNYGKRYSKDILRGIKISDVYSFNDTDTTRFGPAYANIWLEKSNFLACLPPGGRQFSYALCYYSGPDQPTGNDPDNPSLPCTLSRDGVVANCTCYELSTELISPKIPYYVDINAISNLDIYQQTIEVCGKDGLKCASGDIVPPVCDAINVNLLVPGADAISVFSPIFIQNYQSPQDIASGNTSTSCKRKNAALYAGCMTAPCYTTGEKDAQGRNLMECKCPVYDGPFQIGQSDQNCDANDPPTNALSKSMANTRKRHSKNVWSAAYNPNGGPIEIPDGACVPDLPGSKGCELYDDSNSIINPDEAICSKVCSSYDNSTVISDTQVGYSCDATLCTTLGIGQGDNFNPSASDQIQLLGKACDGISKMSGMDQILLVEALAGCSCCASQVCGCDSINSQTNQEIYNLNQEQRDAHITPQCDINNTLCGENE